MNTTKLMWNAENKDDTLYNFASDHSLNNKWKVMIVDDDTLIHDVTKKVLRNFIFEDKSLKFISAHTKEEAKRLILQNPDIAVILLDVMMDGEKAGLEIASYIRNDLKNTYVRIVLRTGQPNDVPEEIVIRDYDINDYKVKNELTATKLCTTMISSLRSYRDLMLIDANKRALEMILHSSSSLQEENSLVKLTDRVLDEILAILNLNPIKTRCKISGFIATKNADTAFHVLSATSSYYQLLGRPIDDISALGQSSVAGTLYHKSFSSKQGHESLIYLENLNGIADWEKQLVDILMVNISVASDNLFLNEEIEETQKEIIFTLGEFSEARSKETSNHVKRVAEYSKLLALKYGLPEQEAEIIRLASPMHDVGKLGITDTILNKPGKLTTEEFEIIKSHGMIGYEILKSSNRKIMQAGAIIALQHHEKYNGEGYPYGLKGDSIHIYGRITAIADVFDALGSERVYKKAWPLEQILAYFEKEKGKHFDSNLVTIFLTHINDFLEIRKELNDRFCFIA